MSENTKSSQPGPHNRVVLLVEPGIYELVGVKAALEWRKKTDVVQELLMRGLISDNLDICDLIEDPLFRRRVEHLKAKMAAPDKKASLSAVS